MKTLKIKTIFLIAALSAMGLVGCSDRNEERKEVAELFMKGCNGKLSTTVFMGEWDNSISLTCDDFTQETAD